MRLDLGEAADAESANKSVKRFNRGGVVAGRLALDHLADKRNQVILFQGRPVKRAGPSLL